MRNIVIIVVVLVVAAVVLSGCGVDGAPQRPVEKPLQQQMGVSVSGDARFGVSANL
ncbi:MULTISPECIES: argininosuccinate lyase [Paracoccus]|uniref:Argininosuccinate lyase n=1 Tax=Paracoccus hibiscisoli TaxID=2023261 RepID=A0A4U0QXL6_9RHOB|nr:MULTISPECIES: argininosuccinate lyase [Paracoccus]TJZ86600.1 argininosuccinate lyase [Paracoccus hibiscisoli]